MEDVKLSTLKQVAGHADDLEISRAFYEGKLDRIKTPTLFLGGAEDHNVPVIHSEQMYMALKRLGVPTELIVYPGQSHGISKPSFQRDVLTRYLAWYERWLR